MKSLIRTQLKPGNLTAPRAFPVEPATQGAVDSLEKGVDLAQKLLGEAYLDAQNARNGYEWRARLRMVPAYTIKAIAIFGGFVIATVPHIDVTIAGTTISASVLLDQWLSNHKRMIVYSVAVAAINRTCRRVAAEYNDKIVGIVSIASDPTKKKEAGQNIISLATSSSKILRSELDRIHTAVEYANIEFLRALNVDQPTQTHLPPASLQTEEQ